MSILKYRVRIMKTSDVPIYVERDPYGNSPIWCGPLTDRTWTGSLKDAISVQTDWMKQGWFVHLEETK